MAAPVINQNSSYRTVYIPDKSMTKLIYKNEIIKNLFLDYEDEEAYEVEDQFIIGKNIMAAPVINQNSSYRTVYIPDKSMAKLIYKNEKIEFDKIVTKGYQNLKNSIDEISVYLKENGIFASCSMVSPVLLILSFSALIALSCLLRFVSHSSFGRSLSYFLSKYLGIGLFLPLKYSPSSAYICSLWLV